jgi:hypothetical protein
MSAQGVEGDVKKNEMNLEGQKTEAEERDERQVEPVVALPLRDLNVMRVVNFTMSLLIDYAWQKMGLVANPLTGKIEQNFDEARFAIDTLVILLEHIKPKLQQREYDQMRQMLTTLRINFVEQLSKAKDDTSPSH